jgi:serine/threonine protein kinase
MKQCRRCNNFFPDDLNTCPLDGVELFSSEDKFVGRIVGGCYRVLSKLAKGGMGTVYLAKHRYLEREVAVKVLKPSISGDEESRKRIIREAKICSTIEHPNIVKVYDLATLEGAICLVMERLEGITLKEALVMEGALNVERVVRIISMVAEALARAHSFGIVHRDIKPGNIFLSSYRGLKDFVKLLDFGIAFTIGGSRLTKEGMLLGTPPYISPEQIQGKEPTKSSDIYSLGCVVFEMLTGKSPFAAPKIEEIIKGHLFNTPEPIKNIRPDVPDEFSAVVLKMLEKDPSSRYQDAFELIDDLQSRNLDVYDADEDEVLRASEQPESHGTDLEIEWNKYFTKIAGDLDEDTEQSMDFNKGMQAAKELAEIENKMKGIVQEMEQLENKRRQYQKNIGIAIDSLGMDLSKIRRELGKGRMEYISLMSEKEYLINKISKAELQLSFFSAARTEHASMSISEKEVALLVEVGNSGKRLSDIIETEKKLKYGREEHKAQIEDLKFQITHLNKRLQEIEGEYNEKYENSRNKLDEISARGEKLRKLAAMAARQVSLSQTVQTARKEKLDE